MRGKKPPPIKHRVAVASAHICSASDIRRVCVMLKKHLKRYITPMDVPYLCEQVSQRHVDFGPQRGPGHVNQSLTVHLLSDLHVLENSQSLFLRSFKALSDDPGVEALSAPTRQETSDLTKFYSIINLIHIL